MFIEQGIRVAPSARLGTLGFGEFRVSHKTLADTIIDFKRIAPLLETGKDGEPSFKQMRKLPEVKEFLSHFKETKPHLEFAAKVRGGKLQKAVIIVDENLKPLAIARWIKGEGGAFFYHGLLDKGTSVEEILASAQGDSR
jgi:hypothetical protein